MSIDQTKLVAQYGYFEGNADAADAADALTAIQYKKMVTRNYINLGPDQIELRLSGTQFFVTRKYDGEMNLLFFDGDQAAIINRSGRIRLGLACVEDAKQALKAAGITQAVVAVELYADESAGRTRIFHVLTALADQAKTATLRLAGFDILQLDGHPFNANSYGETHAKLVELFSTAKMGEAVACRKCKSKAEVIQTYAEWVETDGSEGLVVRTELPLVFKIKPRYTIDVVIVGFSEGSDDHKGQVRTLLLAMMPAPGEFQIIGKTGNGFNTEAKKNLLEQLQPLVVDSQYIETDSNHVAFRMVRPEIVIELMINDVLFDTTTGPIDNPVLRFEQGRFLRTGEVDGISTVYPIFTRFREDKKAEFDDIRLTQINEFSYVEPSDQAGSTKMPTSELLRRLVYTKQSGSKLMIQKFLVWKTNKPAPDYPGYVFHYTNFSTDRKDPLQREVQISNDETQILALLETALTENIKRGWSVVKQGDGSDVSTCQMDNSSRSA